MWLVGAKETLLLAKLAVEREVLRVDVLNDFLAVPAALRSAN